MRPRTPQLSRIEADNIDRLGAEHAAHRLVRQLPGRPDLDDLAYMAAGIPRQPGVTVVICSTGSHPGASGEPSHRPAGPARPVASLPPVATARSRTWSGTRPAGSARLHREDHRKLR